MWLYALGKFITITSEFQLGHGSEFNLQSDQKPAQDPNPIKISWLFLDELRPNAIPTLITIPYDLFHGPVQYCQELFAAEIRKEQKFQADVDSIRFWRPKNPITTQEVCERGWRENFLRNWDDLTITISFTYELSYILAGDLDPHQLYILVKADRVTEVAQAPEEAHDTVASLPEVQHTGYIRAQRFIDKAPSIGAKSSEYAKTQRITDQAVYDGRHELYGGSTLGPPIQIFHPIFEAFIRRLENPQSYTGEFLALVQKFMEKTSGIYPDEKERAWNCTESLTDIIGYDAHLADHYTSADGVFTIEVNGTCIHVLMIELKQELGQSACDPVIQVWFERKAILEGTGSFLAKTREKKPRDIVIKFVTRYGAAVHGFLAENDYAPRLLYYGPVPETGTILENIPLPKTEGAIKRRLLPMMNMVAMEYIEPSEPPTDRKDARRQIEDVLKLLHGKGYVFGDLREPNVLFDQTKKLKLIDFDWAGRYVDPLPSNSSVDLEYAHYPPRLSTSIKWAEGVKDFAPILPQHDVPANFSLANVRRWTGSTCAHTMSDEDSSAEPENSPDATYHSRFRQHLADVQAHLAGREGQVLLPSYIPPTGYWTPLEKDTFFHSLSIYSRLRPDLVAARIGTKTVVDVCAYIDALDDALVQKRHLLQPRSDIECSMEVSEAWALREEQLAEDLICAEPEWEEKILQFQREEEVERKKHASGGDVALEGNWEDDRRRHWSQEDTLGQLDGHQLRVMESILKESEMGEMDVEEAPFDHQQASGLVPSHSHCPQAEVPHAPVPVPTPPDRTPPAAVVNDGLIDPILLRLSGLPIPEQSQHDLASQTQTQSERCYQHEPPPLSLPPPIVTQTLPPKPHIPPASLSSRSTPVPILSQPTSSYTHTHARSPSPSVDRDATVDPSDLSPVSRRRFQKRLYMRRKRAEQRGEEPVAVVAKLRPGRKTKEPKTLAKSSRKKGENTQVEPESLPVEATRVASGPEDDPMDVDVDKVPVKALDVKQVEEVEEEKEDIDDKNDGTRRRRSKGGMTKHYKIKKEFAAKGISADTLINRDLGLFHLSTLSRLMKLYKSGYDSRDSDAAGAISADTIRLMTAIAVEFTTEVVHRTIISREQENHMKSGTKVYGPVREEILVANVDHVLEMMGMQGLTKEKYFAQLLEEDSPDTPEAERDEQLPGSEENDEHEDEGAGDDETDVDDDDDDEDEGSPLSKKPQVFPVLLPLHRETHPPFVHLPKSLTSGGSSVLAIVAPADELLMSADTDEEDLLEELEEEMDIDEADEKLAARFEAGLWKEFGKGSEREQEQEPLGASDDAGDL
ncbi:hypothetical protein H0H81_007521 [Sphagnurus paluster]|uniref:Protein kinase domain-containing protein n=1 Tax=Sphagnurus paluster TaxID=117069 RepID=A0A9P7GNI1_9AGAR|nr:hypothetical protein H0H81_007521 [Sphagnurus paluster]